MLTCGIDFGTSNTLAAVASPDGVTLCEVDPPNLDPHLLPTLLYFSRYGWNRIGSDAMRAYQQDPDGRFIRALKSALPEYAPEDTFRIWKETYTLPGLLHLVLERARERVESTCGQRVTQVTLGRPVRFSTDPVIDRRAESMLREAAQRAGFEQIRFLSEPEAATRYYFATEGEVREATILVFDFGGGTLDLCLAQFGRGGYRVLNTGGAHIGGTLLDRILFEQKLLPHLGSNDTWGRGLELPRSVFNRLVNPDANWRITETEYTAEVRQLLNATQARGKPTRGLRQFYEIVSRRLGPDLFRSIEAAKMRLSEQKRTEIEFQHSGVEISQPLTRTDLRMLFREQLDAIRALIAETLKGAGRGPTDVDRVLLAGGSSALICTQELLHEIFGPERVPLRQDLYTSIVSGLAMDSRDRR